MPELPPEDRPHTFDIGPVHDIPVIDDDDPRFESEREAWTAARATAQALHSADELLKGLRSEVWMVRFEVVDRLIARAAADARTLPALLDVAVNDPKPAVRSAVVMGLKSCPQEAVWETLQRATRDEDDDVRWSASFVLSQLRGGRLAPIETRAQEWFADTRVTVHVVHGVHHGRMAADREEWEAWAAPQRFDGQLDLLWSEIRELLGSNPSDDELCQLAVETVDPLIDLYWPDAIDEFEALALRDSRQRKAVSCCWFDDSVPEPVQARLARLVGPEDDIGSQPSAQ